MDDAEYGRHWQAVVSEHVKAMADRNEGHRLDISHVPGGPSSVRGLPQTIRDFGEDRDGDFPDAPLSRNGHRRGNGPVPPLHAVPPRREVASVAGDNHAAAERNETASPEVKADRDAQLWAAIEAINKRLDAVMAPSINGNGTHDAVVANGHHEPNWQSRTRQVARDEKVMGLLGQ